MPASSGSSSESSTEAPPAQRGRCGPFGWHCEPAGGSSVALRLLGELDLAGATELRYALLTAEQSAAEITVDLTGLEFIDCAAIGVLAEAACRASGRKKRLVLLGGSGQVGRVLELTGSPGGAEHQRMAPRLELVVGRAAAPAEGDRHAL
jgi:anti-anti-sigma factor